ncbi:MAG TPA: N-acetyl-gamma-glutamyl-phosphate reductase [Clostridiaceae bacterium]
MKHKIFVDGQEGTTGLKIDDYLSLREDIELLKIDSEKRKDPKERKKLINKADIVFLCLPDEAAREAVLMIENEKTKVIDASTAHRTDTDWVYGFPELSPNQREKIKNSKRVSVPGCYATGFVSLIYPLISRGILQKDYPVTCCGISGYSGGGKNLIKSYEAGAINNIHSHKYYGLGLKHKHIPEMQIVTGLDYPPVFTPIVQNYYNGMTVSIPLANRLLNKSIYNLQELFEDYYKGESFVRVIPKDYKEYLDNGFLDAEGCNNTNRLDIFVFGNEEEILLTARLDNLGKGASGAAIQNMNIMLGLKEDIGLIK